MSSLPRVAEATRERVSREFDDLGPAACLADIAEDLRRNNPELLDMAMKCAGDVGKPSKVMAGFCMFYRLLAAQAREALVRLPESLAGSLYLLPRVTPATRDLLVSIIDEKGVEDFTRDAVDELERDNPELLQMAHAFASDYEDYLGVLQGFALLYSSLVAQSIADRAYSQ
ncbi:MAG TPA: hypothetical protein VJ011_12795 [Steroidobacteraceae bacterium]|nr:hypothetical protein [Steroidobacteraceae bacterium]